MDLTVFLEPKIDLPRVTHILDGLGPMGRLETIRGWEVGTMRAMWDAARGYRDVALTDFVPASVGAMTEVIHDGKNSLGTFTHFQKRFARSKSGAIFGYNHQEMSGWTGPGYFVVHAWKGEGAGDGGGDGERGGKTEVAIDYREVPEETLESWPPIVPNADRLGRFVYEGMVDVMRGISKHVTIGRARKKGAWMNAWFVLCRVDPG